MKRAGPREPAPSLYPERSLEHHLQADLDLAAAAGAVDRAEGRRVDRGVRGVEAGPVQDVEGLDADLGVPLAVVEAVVLEQREVDVLDAVPAQLGDARRVA